MTEPSLDIFKANPVCKKKTGTTMAEIVKTDSALAIFFENLWKLCR